MVHSVFACSLVHSKDTRPIPAWKTVVVMLVHVGCMLPVCRCAWVSERPRARMCIRVYVCMYVYEYACVGGRVAGWMQVVQYGQEGKFMGLVVWNSGAGSDAERSSPNSYREREKVRRKAAGGEEGTV